jgi:NAD(P)-dependent dehydrogenase (short-subunit alcohol dehydrogenase family)
VRRLSWFAVLGGSAGIGFAVAALWSFAAGLLVAIVLANLGLTAHLRLEKARWIKRFPELAKPGVTWRRRYWL